MLDTLVYILFKKLLTTGCDQGCHELLETCAMEIKRNETVWGGERLDEMKNSGMSETRLCAAESAAVAVSRAPCEGCRRNRPNKDHPRRLV